MLGEERVSVVGLHRSAVEDADAGRGLGAELGDEQRADESVDFLGHGRGGGLAGADRPDGLVSDDDLFSLARGDAGETEFDLTLHHVVRGAGFALGEQLADAEDGLEGSAEGGVDLAVDEGVVFAEDRPTLAVTEDHVADMEVAEHRGRDFAGEGAVGLVVHVLGAHGEVGAFGGGAHRGERGEGRAEDHLDGGLDADGGGDGLDEFGAFGGRLVHLPVTGDERSACGHRSGFG